MYNMVPTNKSQNIIKFEKYKVSNMSDKKAENFVEKMSQKSSIQEKNKNYSLLSDENGTKNHYSISEKCGDKESVNEEVFAEEYFLKNIDKTDPLNSMKSPLKKSKINSKESSVNKGIYSSGKRE